jgi:outer membrane immunogenic protein
MKKIFLATVSLAVLAAPAMAADLARPGPAYKAPPPVYLYSWTGCYVGGFGGGMWVQKDFTLTSVVGIPVPLTDFGSHDASSGIAGIQAGCNYQFAGGWVVGIQGDYGWTSAQSSHVDPFTGVTTLTSSVRSLGSVTGRVGYAWDRFLGYVKGGGAWERDNYTWDVGFLLTGSETRSGWTVGIGGEYALLDWLTGFIEYDYYDFGTRNIAFTFAPVSANFDVRERKSVVKVGLNFKFGGGPAVVARY